MVIIGIHKDVSGNEFLLICGPICIVVGVLVVARIIYKKVKKSRTPSVADDTQSQEQQVDKDLNVLFSLEQNKYE